MEDIPASVRLLDLSRTAITEFASSRIGDNLRDVVVADCKSLKTLTLGPNAAPNVSNLLYTATGCDLLESITLQHIDFEKTYFLHNERGNGKAELVIDRCTLDDNDFPGNFPSVRIANSTFGTLSFEDNKVTESVDLRDSKGKGLFVKKCPKMRSILCPDSGISTFVVENPLRLRRRLHQRPAGRPVPQPLVQDPHGQRLRFLVRERTRLRIPRQGTAGG